MHPFLRLFFVACLISFSSIRPSYAEAKDEPSSEITGKAWSDFRKMDQELTEVYQKTLISLETAAAREKFTDAQNAWLKFREAQGDFAAEGAPSEAQSKLLRATSFTQTTESRLAQLKAWLAAHPKK
jgi:uncharacterized protein YecT (DUF1311 family)